jgi:hypothetical protein
VAPRAYWKGYLKLSLVSCPVALFPASSEREKISFNQINKKTGHRIRYRKIDAETEEEVDSSDIIKGYEVGKGQYIEIEPEELGGNRHREQAHNRDRRVCAEERNRRAVSKQSLLSRPRWRGRPTGVRSHSRGNPQGRNGGARAGCLHLPRAHHRTRTAR